jgi:hypothetical protein
LPKYVAVAWHRTMIILTFRTANTVTKGSINPKTEGLKIKIGKGLSSQIVQWTKIKIMMKAPHISVKGG